MPSVLCSGCRSHLAVIEPYDMSSRKCSACGFSICHPPIRRELKLSTDEATLLEEYRRWLETIEWKPIFSARTRKDPHRYQQLCSAISSGRTWQVKWELVDGADPNQTEELKPFPLHVAAESGNVDIVRLLLSVGADPGNLHDGQTAQECAEKAGRSDVVAYLKKALKGRTTLLWVLRPLNYTLSGYLLPLPFALAATVTRYVPLIIGVFLVGHVLQWLLLRDMSRHKRDSWVGFFLTLVGGGGTIFASGLLVLVLFVSTFFSSQPQQGQGLGILVVMAIACSIITGFGFLQFKLSPGRGML